MVFRFILHSKAVCIFCRSQTIATTRTRNFDQTISNYAKTFVVYNYMAQCSFSQLVCFLFVILMPTWLQMPWMHVKLGFVFLLYIYHGYCHKIYKNQQKGVSLHSSNFFRLWNEGATIILFSVVFLVILKNEINWIFGTIGIILFSVLIMLGYRFYKRIREK